MKGFLSLELLNRLQQAVDRVNDFDNNPWEQLILDIYEDVKPGVALSPVTEMGILSFAESQWGVKTLQEVALKGCAEMGEVADALIKTAEGRATYEDADMEAGDVLVVLSQYAAKRGTTLDALRAMAYQKCKQRVEDAQSDFQFEDFKQAEQRANRELADPVEDITFEDTADSQQGPIYPDGMPNIPATGDHCPTCREFWTDCVCLKKHKPGSSL